MKLNMGIFNVIEHSFYISFIKDILKLIDYY